MFQNVAEVRDFLAWCREQKIQVVEIGGVKAVFSPQAFLPEPRTEEKSTQKKPEVDERTGYTEDELYGSV